MALAIKRVHNLPPHLSYVSTLPDITIRYDSGYLTCSKKLTGSQLSLPQKLKHSIDTWDRTPQGISDKATDQ